ncbi:MAG: excinuclease ABC subunit A [Paracoccaceae bacterium]
MKRLLMLMTFSALTALPVLVAGAGSAYACPPGLAKKDPPCVPPGQVGRGDGNGDDDGRDVVDVSDLFFLDDYPRYGLPALPYGQRYAVVDDQIVVIDAESYEILQLIRLFTALAD